MRAHAADWVVRDCLFLGAVVAVSLFLHVGRLGFYSDDWSVLALYTTSADQSFVGLVQAAYLPLLYRPVHLLYETALYGAFGEDPLGYHLVNALVLASGVVLLYLLLRELRQPRAVALASALIYGLLPNYSTERFWLAAFQATLSMTLCFLSFYSCLRAIRPGDTHFWRWGSLSIVSLLGSTLAYEVFMPFFLLIPALVWHRRGELGSGRPQSPTRVKPWLLSGSAMLALVFVAILKMATVSRVKVYEPTASWASNLDRAVHHFLEIGRGLFSLDYGENDYGLNVIQALRMNYGDYGLGLPITTARLLRDHPDTMTALVGLLVGLTLLWYLHRATRQEVAWPSPMTMLRFAGFGVGLFGLGYAVFLTNPNVQFTLAGIGNRTAIAAAVGVALSMVGVIGFLGGLRPSLQWRRRSFCVLVALVCTSGFLINNTLASFWVEAYRREKDVLADVRERFPDLPSGSALILDGVCPYVGPAIVFESGWDLAGALQVMYRDASLRADVVTPRLRVDEGGLSTRIYGGMNYRYPYDEKLFVYHFRQKAVHPLPDAEAAYEYFRSHNPDFTGGCPTGHEGHGVPVL